MPSLGDALPAGLSGGAILNAVTAFGGASGTALIMQLIRRRPELAALDKTSTADAQRGQAEFVAQVTASATASAVRVEEAQKALAEQYRESARNQDQMGREYDRLTSQVASLLNDARVMRDQLDRADRRIAEADQRIAELERQLDEARNTVALLSRIASRVDEGAATGLRVEAEQGVVRSDLADVAEADRLAQDGPPEP